MDYRSFNNFIPDLNVSRETFSKLELYVDFLLKWNKKINLISKKTSIEQIWKRHILDSAQLNQHLCNNKKLIDFGSGAGFPGVVLAIINEDLQIDLVESDLRKSIFLNEVTSKLSLNVLVHNKRIENIDTTQSDVITSRALATLDLLLQYSYPIADKINYMLFLKGKNVLEEINKAYENWLFEYKLLPSQTDNDGSILKISKLRRK